MRDGGRTAGAAHPGQSALGAARALFDHFNFRVFLVFYALLMVAQSLTPLLIGYGRDVLSFGAADTYRFTIAYYAGTFVLGISVPVLADRFGFRLIAVVAAVLLVVAFVIPVCLPHSPLALLAAYALLVGSGSLGSGLVLPNLGAEMVPQVKPAMIIAVGSVMVMPFSLVAAPLGGKLVDAHGPAGYLAVFVTGLALGLCALLGFVAVIREPRTGQEIYVRMRTE